MSQSKPLLLAAQTDAVEPEQFQRELTQNLTAALLRQPAPPCLLRAPTGSGKTFVITRVLQAISAERPVLWLWFVPFTNLVQQTLDALLANGVGLSPGLLADSRNEDSRAGQVLVSTAQAVARATSRKAGYAADANDQTRSLAALIQRARAQGLQVGLVVDEAHIALDKGTEFGAFAKWLEPSTLLMASATPKDERLSQFLHAAGMSALESFEVSRADVVAARLNKRYVEAVVYKLSPAMQQITEVQHTVLKQAWLRSQKIKRDLATAGVVLTPLLLVQVANGEKSVEDAERALMTVCKVPPQAIGKHSSDEPDPVMMASFTNDMSKEVLIFKQSAGTGFDAPRAFVLASTKPVNDADFAMQFMGRVMRVARPVRAAYPRPVMIPPDFDTAYIYLADAAAQAGFQGAMDASTAVQSQLEGQTEKLVARVTQSGATSYTNRITPQAPVGYDWPLPEAESVGIAEPVPAASPTMQPSLFSAPRQAGKLLDELDVVVQPPAAARKALPRTRASLLAALTEHGIRSYPLKTGLNNLPRALKTEPPPEVDDRTHITETVATRLLLAAIQKTAVQVALNRRKQDEQHTELTSGQQRTEQVRIVIDRNALACNARRVVEDDLRAEEEDLNILARVLAARLRPALIEMLEDSEDATLPDELTLQRQARDAALWVICHQAQELGELMQELIAAQTRVEDSGPLPEMMLFPRELPLAASPRNIYGVMPPSKDDLSRLDGLFMQDEKRWLLDKVMPLDDGELRPGSYDSTLSLNGPEREFAEALDRAPFVDWWHRNPDRKPYAVGLVRGEHINRFYPDFVVCLKHIDGVAGLPRLVETKENVKDASRKARRVPQHYGKVLFLTQDKARLRIVNDDGSLGALVDLEDLLGLREWMRASLPM